MADSSHLTQLSGSCSDRQLNACDKGTDLTAQGILDKAVASALMDCVGECYAGGLQVNVGFAQGCATQFDLGQLDTSSPLDVDSLTQCLKDKLEAVTFDCIGDFACSAVALGGAIPIMCGG